MACPDKAALRNDLKTRIKGVSPADRAAMSENAARLLLATDEYRQARTVMLFVSMVSEIDTLPVAADAWQSGRRIAVPRAHMQSRTMEAVLVNDFAHGMQRTPIGVLEPTGREIVPPEQIDLVIVPGLGFGPAGERIGRGAGFYDRFLVSPYLKAVTCGYGFELQLHEAIPMNPGDVHLQMLVTDRQVRRFRVGNAAQCGL